MAMFSLSRPLILGSGSPRRAELLYLLGFPFSVKTYPTDEAAPAGLGAKEVVLAIARQKALAFSNERRESLILTADTVVDLDGTVLGKPTDSAQAAQMLTALSGRTHLVHTAFCLLDGGREISKVDTAEVEFAALSSMEIDNYIKRFQPMDKAGAYGIQEWIGLVGVKELRGSYFTVMGLPTHLIYMALRPYMISQF